MSASRTPSTWWALLLVPIGLLAGKLIAGLPAPPPRPAAPVAASSPGAHGARAEGAPHATEAPGRAARGIDVVVASPPAPAAAQTPPPTPEYGSGGGVRWMGVGDAWAESQRSGKPVLIDFNAEWCGPCRAMKETVFEDPARAAAIQGAVLPVSVVDRYRESGANPPEIEDLQRRFEIRAFPTLIVISPATGRFLKHEGFPGPEGTQAWIAQAAEAVR